MNEIYEGSRKWRLEFNTKKCHIMELGKSKRRPSADVVHPYGYTTMRYVSSLISGAMIFCVGSGLSIQHGIAGLLEPSEVLPLYWAFYILGGSLITEGGTLLMAVHAIRKGARHQQMSFMEYVLRGQDPSVNVVLLEDMAAVMGVTVALGCMGLTSCLGSHVPDAIGSCLIGGILAAVSGFIIYTNSAALGLKTIEDVEAFMLKHGENIVDSLGEQVDRIETILKI
ncbi:Zinc transporter 9 [Portunus trituberculatus]|uniref:Zinc transporter 9 n=1 Tax=Portunus trituberculatus TaxID=210409 RepID=A0A5B7CHL5_PORTR|nr:Zinc transporter 9 [Portunus trituberculatus]